MKGKTDRLGDSIRHFPLGICDHTHRQFTFGLSDWLVNNKHAHSPHDYVPHCADSKLETHLVELPAWSRFGHHHRFNFRNKST